MDERSKALIYLSQSAGRGFESHWRHMHVYFHFDFFAPFPFRTAQRSQCKWNQAESFTNIHSCFRTQIRLIIQGMYTYNRSIALKTIVQSLSWIVRIWDAKLKFRDPSFVVYSMPGWKVWACGMTKMFRYGVSRRDPLYGTMWERSLHPANLT